MKYRLKKDLPFAEAGTKVQFLYASVKLSNVECYLNAGNNVTFRVTDEDEVGRLFKEGWIEEVKPREWKLLLVNGKPYDYSYAPIESFDKQEIIKVREVLE